MTDSTLPSLDAIQARADAATDGPWEATWGPREPARVWVEDDFDEPLATLAVGAGLDAEFIAAARTDVPVLVAALRAVLDLHEDDGHGECSHCPDPSDAHWSAPWPCPTVRAITAHIDTTPKEKP